MLEITIVAVIALIFISYLIHTVYLLSKKNAALHTELKELQIAYLLNQVAPHFIYNSLISIFQLCKSDLSLAESAVKSLCRYLKYNLTDIKHNKLILLEQELKNIHDYIAIEKIRFGERINVIFDIRSRGFKVPIFSIQLLVENSIQHNIVNKYDMEIIIFTFDDKDNYYIRVVDNGFGFDTKTLSKKEDRLNIGIQNIKDRIELQLNGSISFDSIIGYGTIVEIIIPKRNLNSA